MQNRLINQTDEARESNRIAIYLLKEALNGFQQQIAQSPTNETMIKGVLHQERTPRKPEDIERFRRMLAAIRECME